MSRFRPFATVLILLATVLTTSPLMARGGKAAAPHRAAPHPRRAAPRVHPAHHTVPKPNRVAHKPAHHPGHPAHKAVHHPAKPKAAVKGARPPKKPKKPVKVARPKARPKEPSKLPPSGEKPNTPTKLDKLEQRPKQPTKLPRPIIGKPKEPTKIAKPMPKPKIPPKMLRPEEPLHFVGRRHTPIHHFAHFDGRNGRFWFDRDWWYRFVDYPNSCDQGLDVPTDYAAVGDDWPVNYDALVPPADGQVAPPVIGTEQGLPISRAGAILAERLDAMDVENRWLPGQDVNWNTGNPIDGGPGPASNGGGFVDAVCASLKVPMNDPVPENFSPATQYDWLVNEGTTHGWVMVGDIEAQLLANQGWMVIAAWKSGISEGDQSLDGQTAIVRPSAKPAGEVAERGPQISVAGWQNHNDIALKSVFPPIAWNQAVYAAFRPRW
jgi:hypothetical protein